MTPSLATAKQTADTGRARAVPSDDSQGVSLQQAKDGRSPTRAIASRVQGLQSREIGARAGARQGAAVECESTKAKRSTTHAAQSGTSKSDLAHTCSLILLRGVTELFFQACKGEVVTVELWTDASVQGTLAECDFQMK